MATLSLSEVFKETRVTKTIVAVDLTNSTAMKEQQPEVAWLSTYAWFFELLGRTIQDAHGKIVKYLGDGAMAVFDEEHPADAINWAVVIQEEIVDAQESKRAFFDCSIAITYGKIVEFDTPDATRDYIGSVVDKAFRLCSVANAKAIFVDADTIIAAPMHRIKSRVGVNSMPRRTATEYQGAIQSAKVKGFSQPVDYHEILWASSPYGVRKEFVTNLSAKVEQAPTKIAARPAELVAKAPNGWSTKGKVVRFSDNFGFIRTPTGEDLWFSKDYLFRRDFQIKRGDEVWCNQTEPFPGRQGGRAVDVVPLGVELDGMIEKIIPAKGFCFVACTSDRHETKQVFVFLGHETAATLAPGARLTFTVGENNQGLAGIASETVTST
jgi:class 3 adenylate cyclase/cold shock CspA family protein